MRYQAATDQRRPEPCTQIRDAILASAESLAGSAGLPVPDHYRGIMVHADEADMFAGLPTRDKDPRKSPAPAGGADARSWGPGEALIAVMASAINYNTVWTSIFEPVSTFELPARYARSSELARKHDQPYHVVGSDLAGVVLRTGPGVSRWQVGDRVVAHCLSVELEEPQGHDDTMMDPQQRIWGFETNFGGLAELALVKSNQLMPKPEHLTWEEAACPGLVNSTAYRQLVSHNGASMKQGDIVLIWGASGGLGGYATQYALNGGAIPVCVVSSPDKAELCRRMGAELIIDRSAEGYRFWKDPHTQDQSEWKRLGARIRELTGGDDPDIVFEHPGRETFGASVYVARRGGTDRHLRLDLGLPARVRQPLPVDEPQADHRLALRQLPGVLGGQPADRQGRHPPDAVAGLPAGRDRPGRLRRAPQRPPGQGRACCAWPTAEGQGVTAPELRAGTWTRSTASATPERQADDRPPARRRGCLAAGCRPRLRRSHTGAERATMEAWQQKTTAPNSCR